MTPSNPAALPLACDGSPRSVLLVDQSPENREVLRFALERRGVEILEAEETAAGLELVRSRRPQVVVLDLEVADAEEEETANEFGKAAEPHAGQLVVLGNLRVSGDAAGAGSFFAKPYHFAPLILRIEELLSR